MVYRAVEDEAEDQGIERVYRMDDGQEVRVGISVVPQATEKRIHADVYGRMRLDKVQKQSASRASDQAVEKAVRRAVVAVKWTKGFDLEVVGPTSARVYGELLGEELQVGQVVNLDNRWTDALKRHVFGGFVAFAMWASEESYRVMGAAVQEERDRGED
jgi:hypothetical protein